MRFSKALRFRSISILFISIFVALQVHFFPALRPANSEPVTLGTIAAVVALVKAVSASGLARGVCFSGLHMGANECRKPSRCVEGIERLEKIVNTNGSSESVRQLENWIGSASQNERCAISLSRHITGGVNIVDLTRQAVAELDRLRNPTITSFGAIAIGNVGSRRYYGWSWNASSLENATSSALRSCGQTNCEAYGGSNGFTSIAVSNDFYWGIGTSNSANGSRDNAIKFCRQSSRVPDTCQVVLVIDHKDGVVFKDLR